MTSRHQPPLRCAIIGCGQVAQEYLTTLQHAADLTVVACADIDLSAAKSFAERHGIPEVGAPGDILATTNIDVAVILTPPATHVDLAHDALDAGAHVYVEKPLGLTAAESERLLRAASDKGLLVGAAPDTVLAPSARAAHHALATGAVGTPVAADAALLAPGPESWHPTPQPFYASGAGPLGDMGPYYLAMLTYLLGPIEYVEASATSTRSERTIRTGPHAGDIFRTDTPTHVVAFLRSRSQALITVTTSFDIAATARPHLEIYGTDGSLVLPDPNFHDGSVRYRRRGEQTWQELPQDDAVASAGRGLGVLDLVDSIRNDASECPSGHRAHHVVEVIEAIEFARTSGHPAELRLLREERCAGLR
ncbi:Gfo/Idh/MocA family oxidoreductase [Amycolatopsis sp. K13G38]|uniref:Gfo/Idh/MocA family oxidoreductase n=1 Tax=Amycolatopsis acididurans TaxID=2724524 RepID=A0ABX1JAZ9_9PSEU|nr:Gfo/Idh/MocA family oxidoreductase [Amycolatopsis acididurans]NKQ55591.1 Gfo/Idh/MocA family oxidoreductase [Amycolatopsis acididurans]